MQSASTNITTFPGKVGISNANPTHTLAIGSNVYVDDTGSNKLTVTGVISGDGLGISNIQTANVLGLTDNVTRITTLETDLDNNSSRITTVSTDLSDNSARITTVSTDLSDNSSRVTSLETDLTSNASRVTSLETDLTSNASRVTSLETDLTSNASRVTSLETDLTSNASRVTSLETDLTSNASRVTSLETDLADNSSRIDSLGDGAHTFAGVKTFQDDIILESNLRVNGDLTYANTVNMIVSDPIIELGANNQHTNDLGLVLTRHGNSGNDSNVAIFYDESHDNLKIGYTDDSASQTTLSTTATGLDVSITGNVAAAYDADTTSYFGRAAVGYMGQSDQASFSHIDKNTSTNFALKQAASGATHLNTPTGQHIRFSVNAAEVGRFTGGGDFKVGANKLYVDTSASEVQMYSQATGSTAGPDLLLMRDNPNNGSNGDYIGQVRYEGISSTGTSRLYAKTTGKIKTATNGSESGIIETALRTSGSQRISVRHSGDLFHIKNGTDLQVGEVANLYVDTSTSRVGIKKSNPSYTLDVDGDINLSGDFYQGGSPFVSSLWTSSGTDLYYSSGSVGISNAAPDHDLSVGSNLYVHDTGSNVLVVDGNVNVSNTISTHRLTLNNVSITTTMDLAQVSNVGNVTSNVLQFTNPTTAFVTTGAVGIGTASPRDVEHIWKDGSNGDHGLLIEQNNAGTGSATLKFGVAHTTESTTGLSKAGIFFRRADTKGRGDLLFCVDNANDTNDVDTSNHAMTIYRDGNIGIGTTVPAATLDVRGAVDDPSIPTVHIGDNSADAGDYGMVNLVRDPTNGGSKSHLAFIRHGNTVVGMGFHNNTNTWGIFPSFSSVTNTPALAINYSGNVGVGTATPDGPLHVFKAGGNAGDVGGGIIMERWDNYGCAIWSQYPSGGTVDCMNFRCVNNASDAYGGTPQMVLTHEGRVGIGTTGPEDILDIRKGSGTNEVFQVRSGGLFIRRHNGSNYPLIQTDFGMSRPRIMMTDTGNTTRVFISGDTADPTYFNGGNVGIGETSPSSKLHVDGRIMSNQPRFFAWSNSGSVGFSGSGPIVLNSTAYNSGSHYSTGTGYFTAPVNGVYHFTVGVYTYNATQFSWKLVPTAGSLSNNNAHVSRNNNSGDDLLLVQAFNSGQHGGSITIYLNANEQFGWGSRSSSGNYYGAHSHFSGYLLSQV